MATTHEHTGMTNPTAAERPVSQKADQTKALHGKAEEIGAQIQDSAREVARQFKELGEQVRELAAEYYQQGQERALAWERRVETQIREKPIQSLLIAGGFGLLFGLLWRRR